MHSTMTQLIQKHHGIIKSGPVPIKVHNFYRTKLAHLIYGLGLKKGAEIGIKKGIFSEALCRRISGIDLLCVDNWEEEDSEECYELARGRLQPYNVTFIEKPSMKAVQDVLGGSLDFVYIDADHDLVAQDLLEWEKRVRPGGIIAGHDYQLQGVKNAVDTYTKAHDIEEWFLSSNHWPSFFWRKNDNESRH